MAFNQHKVVQIDDASDPLSIPGSTFGGKLEGVLIVASQHKWSKMFLPHSIPVRCRHSVLVSIILISFISF
jgi:hypothetical protein